MSGRAEEEVRNAERSLLLMGKSELQLRSGTIAVLSIQATQFSFNDLINLLICICDDFYFCLILYNVYSRHQLKLVNLLIRAEQLGFYFGVCRTCRVYKVSKVEELYV